MSGDSASAPNMNMSGEPPVLRQAAEAIFLRDAHEVGDKVHHVDRGADLSLKTARPSTMDREPLRVWHWNTTSALCVSVCGCSLQVDVT